VDRTCLLWWSGVVLYMFMTFSIIIFFEFVRYLKRLGFTLVYLRFGWCRAN
jgi:hypothetical protein